MSLWWEVSPVTTLNHKETWEMQISVGWPCTQEKEQNEFWGQPVVYYIIMFMLYTLKKNNVGWKYTQMFPVAISS